MENYLNKKTNQKWIGIIMLSPEDIESILIEQKKLKSKKFKIGQLRKKTNNIYSDKLISNNKISFIEFKKEVLPIFNRHIQFSTYKKPIVLKILCKDEFYSATNSQDLFDFIENEIKKHKSPSCKIIFEPLSIIKESYYGFISFLRTTRVNSKSNSNIDRKINDFYFFKGRYLHVNINNRFTQVSIFTGENFSNTYNLPLGLVDVSESLSSDIILTEEIIKKKLDKYKEVIKNEILKNPPFSGLRMTSIATGTELIVEGVEYDQFRSSIYVQGLLEKSVLTLPKTLNSLQKNNLITLQQLHISKVAGLFIASEIFNEYAGFDTYLNPANNLIGCAFTLLDE